MKRAQGLPINTIIIAALALIVLFILIGIVGFRTQKFGKEVSTVTQGETCAHPCHITKCDDALVGNFVKSDGSKLAFNEVCCATACKP
jgi:hypothetical protein